MMPVGGGGGSRLQRMQAGEAISDEELRLPFNQRPEDLAKIGRKGGLASGVTRRLKALREEGLSEAMYTGPEIDRETTHQAAGAIDDQFPWLRDAFKKDAGFLARQEARRAGENSAVETRAARRCERPARWLRCGYEAPLRGRCCGPSIPTREALGFRNTFRTVRNGPPIYLRRTPTGLKRSAFQSRARSLTDSARLCQDRPRADPHHGQRNRGSPRGPHFAATDNRPVPRLGRSHFQEVQTPVLRRRRHRRADRHGNRTPGRGRCAGRGHTEAGHQPQYGRQPEFRFTDAPNGRRHCHVDVRRARFY